MVTKGVNSHCWFDSTLCVVSLAKSLDSNTQGAIGFIYVYDDTVFEKLVQVIKNIAPLPCVATNIGKESQIKIYFPTTWTAHRVCRFLDQISQGISSKAKVNVDKRFNFPSTKITRYQIFNKDVDYHPIDSSFVEWCDAVQKLEGLTEEEENGEEGFQFFIE